MVIPEFVQGDTRKALTVTLKAHSAPANLAGGSVKLFATGIDSNDKPTSNPGELTWNGVTGVFVTDGSNGKASFLGLGGLVNVGAGRRGDRYRYQIKFTDASAQVSWSAVGYFTVVKAPA